MLRKELVAATGVVALMFFVLLIKYQRYSSITDCLLILDQQKYSAVYISILLSAMLYLLLLVVRILLFPGLTNLEMTQMYRSIKTNNLVKIFDFVYYTDIKSQNFIRALLLSITTMQVLTCTQLFEQRVNLIHSEQQQLELLRGGQLRLKGRYVRIMYRNILRPVVVLPLLLFYITVFNFGLEGKSLTLGVVRQHILTDQLDIYQKQLAFICMHLFFWYLKNIILICINYLQLNVLKGKQLTVNLILCSVSVVFQLLETIIVSVDFVNTCLLFSRRLSILDVLGQLRRRELNLQPGNRRKPQIYLVFSDLYNCIDRISELKKQAKKLQLVWRCVRFLDQLQTPTIQELYQTSDAKEARAAVAETQCTICLLEMDLFKEPRSCKRLGCGHCYHETCIRQWIVQGNDSCPLCKRKIFEHAEIDLAELRGRERNDDDAQIPADVMPPEEPPNAAPDAGVVFATEGTNVVPDVTDMQTQPVEPNEQQPPATNEDEQASGLSGSREQMAPLPRNALVQNRTKLFDLPLYTQQDPDRINEELLLRELTDQFRQVIELFVAQRYMRANLGVQRQLYYDIAHADGAQFDVEWLPDDMPEGGKGTQ